MKNNVFSIVNKNYQQWAPVLLRLVIGYGFIIHGWAKLSKGSPAGFEKLLAYAGAPYPHILAWVASLTEVLTGLAMCAGFFVSITAVPMLVVMLAAMLTVNMQYGFSSVKTIGLTPQGPVFGPPGYEINLLYMAGLISLISTGAGAFSADALMAGRRTSK